MTEDAHDSETLRQAALPVPAGGRGENGSKGESAFAATEFPGGELVLSAPCISMSNDDARSAPPAPRRAAPRPSAEGRGG